MLDDTVFEALADRQRRELLVRLRSNGSERIPKLSRTSRSIAAANESLLEAYLSGSIEVEVADRGLLRLYLVHLPKLAEYGFIEWDREGCRIAKGPRFDELLPVLDLLDDHRDGRTARLTDSAL